MATPGPVDSGRYRRTDMALSCFHEMPVFSGGSRSKYPLPVLGVGAQARHIARPASKNNQATRNHLIAPTTKPGIVYPGAMRRPSVPSRGDERFLKLDPRYDLAAPWRIRGARAGDVRA